MRASWVVVLGLMACDGGDKGDGSAPPEDVFLEADGAWMRIPAAIYDEEAGFSIESVSPPANIPASWWTVSGAWSVQPERVDLEDFVTIGIAYEDDGVGMAVIGLDGEGDVTWEQRAPAEDEDGYAVFEVDRLGVFVVVGPGPDADGDGARFATDCDDADDTVYPGAAELCDGKDNDCDGTLDEGLDHQDFYADADGDGFGDPAAPQPACAAPADHVADGTDCDDADDTVGGLPAGAIRVDLPGDAQDAVDAAPDGSVLAFGPGTWTQSIALVDRSLTVRGTCPDVVVFDGEGQRRPLRVQGGDVTLEQLVIRNGMAEDGGGGLRVEGAAVVVRDARFEQNHGSDGGGIRVISDQGPPTLTVERVDFVGNTAEGWGGAIYADGGELSLASCVFEADTASTGGGVGAYATAVTSRDDLFDGCSAPLGGAIYLSGGLADIEGTIIQGSTAEVGAGLGLFQVPSARVVHVRIEDCEASFAGGGFYAGASSGAVETLEVRDDVAVDAYGGGVLIEGGVWTVDGLVAEGNVAGSFGGGISAVGTVTLANLDLSGNQAGAHGGGAWLSGDLQSVTGGTIIGNEAALDGGGLALWDVPGTASLTDLMVADNIATNGGGVALRQAVVTLDDLEIQGNTAHERGGGIRTDSDGDLFSSLIAGNQAHDGAGIAIYGGAPFVEDCEIGANAAAGNGGGALVEAGGTLWPSDNRFDDNASAAGGAIYVEAGGAILGDDEQPLPRLDHPACGDEENNLYGVNGPNQPDDVRFEDAAACPF